MSDNYGQAAALLEIESELGDVLTLNSVDYPCIIGARTDGAELGAGGFALSAGLEIVCRRSLFQTLPTTNDNVTVNGRVHKIMSVVTDPSGACFVMQTDDVNKDA